MEPKAGRQVAVCGFVCSECPCFLATRANDTEAALKIASGWSERYHVEVPVEAVWCDGCLSDSSRRCAYCATCKIRACATGRNLASCALCDQYGCGDLEAFWKMAPKARDELDARRRG